MSCGCKNKQKQTQPQSTVQTQQTKPTNTIQEAIKKTVEKYYNKK